MNSAKKLLNSAAVKFALPADIVAGLPKIELTGNQEFSMEPHKGLRSYADQEISIGSNVGTVFLKGAGLRIKLMNRERITVSGKIRMVELLGDGNE